MSEPTIVVEKLSKPFLEKFRVALAPLQPGDPLNPSGTLGPRSTESALLQLFVQVNIDVANGTRIFQGDSHINRGCVFVQPNILKDISPDNPALRDEFFGTLAIFFPVKDKEAAIALDNDCDQALV